MIFLYPFRECTGEQGHGSFLRTYVSRNVHCEAVCFADGSAGKDSAYGVGHFHFRGVSVGCLFRGEYETASCAAGENQSLQRVSLQQRPASFFLAHAGQGEQPCHDVEFFVVDFKDVALLQTGGDNLLCIETLPEVDVEYLVLSVPVRHGVKKPVDGGA